MSSYKDAKTPTEKLLRNPGGKSEGKAGGDRPSLGRPGPVPEPPEACQRHFRGTFLGVGDWGTRGVHGASGASQHLGRGGHQPWRLREYALPLGERKGTSYDYSLN